MPKNKLWVYIAAVGTLLGLLVSASALGMVMPWQAAKASETAKQEEVDRLTRRVGRVENEYSTINGKLDTIIQLMPKK